MKKQIWIAVSLASCMVGCKKDFLDLSPISNANVSGFYRNAADIEVAVTSAYASLCRDGQYRISMWQIGEVRSDNSWNWEGGGNLPDAEIDQFKESSSNNIINLAWLDAYHGILLCNIVLNRIGPITMSEDLKKQFRGEVLFLRSLMYFNLVRTFGDVPLVLQETSTVQEGYQHGRTPVADVYNQIIKDLTEAAVILPVSYDGNNVGRATSGAAKSLLGKVYLTQKNYSSAAIVLKEVIDAGRYRLLQDYADLWLPSNANHAESIFEVQFKKGGTGTGSPFTNFFAPRDSELAVTKVGYAYGRNLPTADMVSAYEMGDKRKISSVAETYQRDGLTISDPYTVKYRDVPFAELDADNNWTVLRYADILLMYAEVLNEINEGPVAEAYNMMNLVRDRAGLDSLSNGLNKTDFAMALEHERRVEFAFEGHRWFDLVRTGRAIEVMNAHFNGVISIKPFQLLFPVPQSQVNINPDLITQNDGY